MAPSGGSVSSLRNASNRAACVVLILLISSSVGLPLLKIASYTLHGTPSDYGVFPELWHHVVVQYSALTMGAATRVQTGRESEGDIVTAG